MADLRDILTQIDRGDDADVIREALGERLMACLVEQGNALTSWELIHCGIAIDLLTSPWLRLAWTHVDSACNDREADSRARGHVPPPESVPTVSDLFVKLTDVLSRINDRRRLMSMASPEGRPAH